ncbi:LIC_10190 family membrane protein [Candidatus Pelagibacter sp.]|uniref:LIC_10190 family membrane protein n=1 Tax=Candidatus Pelagibacter sp. TaxID=2024849 RepID=UPI003F87171D
MIISTIFNLFLILIITGYSFFFKNFIIKNDNDVSNLDLLYGIIFLILLSTVLNLLFPLKYFFYITVFFGFVFFISALKKKKININFTYHLLILFSLTFIVYSHGNNVDTPMYHLQIIKWLHSEKVVFGLSNLEIRFGLSSLWFNLLALLKFKLNDYTNIYTFNLIPFTILIYQIFDKKKSLSYFFITLSISFLLLFSLIHPFANGIILNHLHNTDLDTVGMVFFILSFFLFIKFFEEQDIKILRLLVISSSICIFIKLSYISASIFILVSIIIFHKKNLIQIFKENINIFIIILFLVWLIKNLIISGCLIFPVISTCINLDWTPNINDIEFFSNETKGFARDTRDRLRYTDFNHTIYTLDWLMPWFKDYVLNTSFIIISFFVTISSLFFLCIFNYIKFLNIDFSTKIIDYLIIFLVFIPCFYIWFQAPEIRFGWGIFISLSCFSVAILMFHIKFNKIFKLWIFQFVPITLLCLLLIDNSKNFSVQNFINPYIKNINYSQIVKINSINGFEIYKSTNWQCFDFDKICINSEKEKYDIHKKYGYLVIKGNFN